MLSVWYYDILRSQLTKIATVLVHSGDEPVARRGAEGVGLQLVLVHYVVPFDVHPGLSEQTCPQLEILVELPLPTDDGLVVLRVEFVLGILEVPPFICWKFQT
jgi:hypothetical protein